MSGATNDGRSARIALVTGASRGIGRAIARRIAADGTLVLAAATTAERAAPTVDTIRDAGGRAEAVGLDVASDDTVERVVAELTETHGKITLLVNNAGITGDGLLMRMKPDQWTRVIETNLYGVYRMCRAVVPAMIRSKFGRIVNVTSVVASMGNPGQANYAASKSGIEGFSRSLAREVASRNVTVNCVAPGFIETDMTRELGDAARDSLKAQIPMNRLGRPEDVAGAVGFLLSDEASYVTGATLHVNGGMYTN